MTRKGWRKIIIDLEPDEDASLALEQVARLLREGYTSGIDPNWRIEE